MKAPPMPSSARAKAQRSKRNRAKRGLDTSANSFSAGTDGKASPAYKARRKLRMERRTVAQMVTTHPRFEQCGRVAYGPAVALRLSDGVAGVAGVETCGSVWCCSVCSAKIAAKRCDEISRGLQSWWGKGNDVVMLTLTMRHNRGHRAATLWDAVSYAWNGVTSGRQWLTEKASHNVAGWLRVVEVTQGRNGWHVHIHVLLFLRRDNTFAGAGITIPDLIHWKARIVQRWSTRLERKGFTCVDDAQDMRLVARGETVMADYFTKAQDYGDATAREVSQAGGKLANGDNRTPWQILDDLILYGEAHDAMLWQEYVDASAGRRQMTWGKGTRAALDLTDEEQTDEDIADEELGSAEDDMVLMSSSDWFKVSRSGTAVANLLDVLELDGPMACVALAHEYGLRTAEVASGTRYHP